MTVKERGTIGPRVRPSIPVLPLVVAVFLSSMGCIDRAAEHRVRANAMLRGGDAAAALKECDQGLAQKKDDTALLILRGKALFELDKLDESKAAYESALRAGEKEPKRALSEAYLGLGMIGARTKAWADARRNFEALVAIDKGDVTSRLNVARVCLELKDIPCAIEHAEAAGRVPFRGNEEPVLYTIGTVYLVADKIREAELTFQHICDVVPGAATCPYGLARAAAKRGDRRKMLDELGKAIDKRVPSPDKIPSEPEFVAYKDDPEFVALVAKATKK